MNPQFLETARTYFETELSWWRTQGSELARQSLATAEQALTEARTRFQTAAEAQSATLLSLARHHVEAIERGVKVYAEAVHQ